VNRRTFSAFVAVSLACFGCDQVSKELARVHLEASSAISLLQGAVELRLAHNPGAFLSLGASLPEGVRIVVLQVLVPIVLVLLCGLLLRRASVVEAVGIAFVLGGGAGNWIDRVLNEGAVTDFVRMGLGSLHTGIFNLADVAILLGAAILLLRANRRLEPKTEGGIEP
jgi:signal peptidase II